MMQNSPRFSLLRQITGATILGTGFGTIWFLLVIWLTTSLQEVWRGGKAKWPPRDELVVTSDGTLLIRNTQWDDLNQITTTFRDLNGGKQADQGSEKLLPSISMAGEHEAPGVFSPRAAWARRLKPFVNEREPNVNWYFVHDGKEDGAGYFVGYQRESNRRVGFIGLAGARSDPVPINEWIPVRGSLAADFSLWSSPPLNIYWENSNREFKVGPLDLPPRLVYVPSGNRLRQVDLAAGTVRTVLETPEPIESPGIPALESWSAGHAVKEQPILARTKSQIYVLDRQHRIVRQFAIPAEIDRNSPATWYELGSGQAFAEFVLPSASTKPDGFNHQIVYRIAADGRPQNRFEVSLQSGSLQTDEATTLMQVILGLPSPAFLVVVEPFFLMEMDRTLSYPAAIIALFAKLSPAFLAVFALTSILAVMTWRRSRAFGLPARQQIAWTVFVFLLGLPAFAGYLLCRRWPVRVPCPNCHVNPPRDRPACATCGTTFPDPALKGIEIFA
jgi:hypothetical protein